MTTTPVPSNSAGSADTGTVDAAATADHAVDWPARKLRRFRRSRWLSGSGGLLLAVSFFLPAVPVCGKPMTPALEWADAFDGGLPSIVEFCMAFIMMGAAYVLGLLVFIMAVRGRLYRKKTELSLGLSVSWFIGLVAGMFALIFLAALLSGDLDGDWEIMLVLVAIATAYWLRSLKLGIAGLLCARWLGAMCCTVWFSLFFLGGDSLYGLWLSLAGSILIVVGTTMEACIRGRQGTWTTVWDILRCRLQLYDLDGNRCQTCGYLLIGLTSSRCPECGEAIPVQVAQPPPIPTG